ncbi:MAG: hypothetical protein JWN39_1914 [Ilumatobacteraceae bacterium]|nr:hypothetical protein [Ilumatobacteraceae bacterium]
MRHSSDGRRKPVIGGRPETRGRPGNRVDGGEGMPVRAGAEGRRGQPWRPEVKARAANRNRSRKAEGMGTPRVEVTVWPSQDGRAEDGTASTAEGAKRATAERRRHLGDVEPACRGDQPENGLTRRSLLRRVRSCSSQRVTPDVRSAVDHPTRAALGGAPSPPTAAQPRAVFVFTSRTGDLDRCHRVSASRGHWVTALEIVGTQETASSFQSLYWSTLPLAASM